MGATRDLGRKSVVLVVATWLASSIGFLSTLLIARRLGPGALGALGFGFGLVGVLSAVVLPGFARAHTKRVAEGRDLGRCLGTMVTLQLGLQAVMVLLFAGAWRTWPGLVPEEVAGGVLWSLLASQVLASLSGAFTGAFVGREWTVAYGLVLIASRFARFVALVAVLIWLPDIRWVAAAYPLEGVVALLLGLYVVVYRRGTRLRLPDRETLRAYWSYARPLLVTTPIGMLQDSLDRVVVARWAGLGPAGYYQVARALWELLGSLNAYPFQLLFARLSSLFAGRSPAADTEARRLFASAVDKLLFLAVPLAFLLWAFRSPIVALLYGPAFAPAVGPLAVFVVAALAQAALNPYQFVIYALEQHARLVPGRAAPSGRVPGGHGPGGPAVGGPAGPRESGCSWSCSRRGYSSAGRGSWRESAFSPARGPTSSGSPCSPSAPTVPGGAGPPRGPRDACSGRGSAGRRGPLRALAVARSPGHHGQSQVLPGPDSPGAVRGLPEDQRTMSPRIP